MLDEDVPFRSPWRRRPTLRHRFWQLRRRAGRFARTPWLLLVAALGAVIGGWFWPDLHASGVAAWLRDPDHVVAWAREVVHGGDDPDVVVLRPRPVAGVGDFQLCGGWKMSNCVIDGDTIRHQGVKIRLADIDTPEVFSPKCPYEANLGRQATERLLELINAGPFEVVRADRDADRYGRKLRILQRYGRSLGDTLVAEGLARRWDGARHSWCG